MYRVIALAVVIIFGGSSPAVAQQVEVRRKAGATEYTVRRVVRWLKSLDPIDEPVSFHKTLAAAQVAASRVRKFDGLLSVYIEGPDTAGEKPQADADPRKRNPTFSSLFTTLDGGLVDPGPSLAAAGEAKQKVDDVSLAYKLITDPTGLAEEKAQELKRNLGPGRSLKEYGEGVANAYGLAAAAKEKLLEGLSTATDKEFNAANELVKKYNDEALTLSAAAGRTGLFPAITPADRAGMTKLVTDWQTARSRQIELEEDKQKLDAQKTILDRERVALLEEWNMLGTKPDPTSPEVLKLRERFTTYANSLDKYTDRHNTYIVNVKLLADTINNLNGGNTGPPTIEGIAGDWTYKGRNYDGDIADLTDLTITKDGKAYHDRGSPCPCLGEVTISGNKVNVVAKGFTGKVHVKFELTYSGGKLVGNKYYMAGEGWGEPYNVSYTKAKK